MDKIKLKFFERNEVESLKTGIVTTTNDTNNNNPSTNTIANVRNNSDDYLGSESSAQFRTLSKTISLLPFSTNGESFSENFRIENITRGQGEIRSSLTAPASTKSISTNFQGTATTPPRQSDFRARDVSGELFRPDLVIDQIQYSPYIALRLGNNNSRRFEVINGFGDSRYNEKKRFLNSDNRVIGYYSDTLNRFISINDFNQGDTQGLQEIYREENSRTIEKRITINGLQFDIRYDIITENIYYDFLLTNNDNLGTGQTGSNDFSVFSPFIQNIRIDNFESVLIQEGGIRQVTSLPSTSDSSVGDVVLLTQASGGNDKGIYFFRNNTWVDTFNPEAFVDASVSGGNNLILTRQGGGSAGGNFASGSSGQINFEKQNGEDESVEINPDSTYIRDVGFGIRQVWNLYDPSPSQGIDYFLSYSSFGTINWLTTHRFANEGTHTSTVNDIVSSLRFIANNTPIVACSYSGSIRRGWIDISSLSSVQSSDILDFKEVTNAPDFINNRFNLSSNITNQFIYSHNRSFSDVRFIEDFESFANSDIPDAFYTDRMVPIGYLPAPPSGNQGSEGGASGDGAGGAGGASGDGSATAQSQAQGQQENEQSNLIGFGDTGDNLTTENYLQVSATISNLGLEGNSISFECSDYLPQNFLTSQSFNAESTTTDSLRQRAGYFFISNRFNLINRSGGNSSLFLKDEFGNEIDLNNYLPITPKTDNTREYVIHESRNDEDFFITRQTNTTDTDSMTSQDECPTNSITGRITFNRGVTSYDSFSDSVLRQFTLIDDRGNTSVFSFNRQPSSSLDDFTNEIRPASVYRSNTFYNLIAPSRFTIRDWINSLGTDTTEFQRNREMASLQSRRREFRLIKTGGDAMFDLLNENNIGLETVISNLSNEFPFVRIRNLQYNQDTNQLRLELQRSSDNAPIPSADFFDSVTIGGTTFNFTNASYSTIDDDDERYSIYNWTTSNNPTGACGTSYSIAFAKQGTSNTNGISVERLVQKSSFVNNTNSVIPFSIGGILLNNISFDSDSFALEFKEDIVASDFYSVSVLVNNERITRELLYSDGTISNNNRTITWQNSPEFSEIRENKEYTLLMKKGVSTTELQWFNPNPSGDWHFIKDIESDGSSFSFTLDSNGSEKVSENPFVSFNLNDSSSNSVIPITNEEDLNREGNTYSLDTSYDFTEGDYTIEFNVEDHTPFEVVFTQVQRDFFFDTIILLDTNLDDIYVTNTLDVPLIHSSDKYEFESVNELGERHVRLELRNPITAMEVKLKNRRFTGERREIGQILLFKKIGEASQYPDVSIEVRSKKTETRSQFNLSHIKTLPTSLSINLDFPATDDQDTLLLAQDLFCRVSDYNEFVTWLSGGFVSQKVNGMRGYRFKDFINTLTLNNFNFRYIDGRLSSGIEFNMQLAEVT